MLKYSFVQCSVRLKGFPEKLNLGFWWTIFFRNVKVIWDLLHFLFCLIRPIPTCWGHTWTVWRRKTKRVKARRQKLHSDGHGESRESSCWFSLFLGHLQLCHPPLDPNLYPQTALPTETTSLLPAAAAAGRAFRHSVDLWCSTAAKRGKGVFLFWNILILSWSSPCEWTLRRLCTVCPSPFETVQLVKQVELAEMVPCVLWVGHGFTIMIWEILVFLPSLLQKFMSVVQVLYSPTLPFNSFGSRTYRNVCLSENWSLLPVLYRTSVFVQITCALNIAPFLFPPQTSPGRRICLLVKC